MMLVNVTSLECDLTHRPEEDRFNILVFNPALVDTAGMQREGSSHVVCFKQLKIVS